MKKDEVKLLSALERRALFRVAERREDIGNAAGRALPDLLAERRPHVRHVSLLADEHHLMYISCTLNRKWRRKNIQGCNKGYHLRVGITGTDGARCVQRGGAGTNDQVGNVLWKRSERFACWSLELLV